MIHQADVTISPIGHDPKIKMVILQGPSFVFQFLARLEWLVRLMLLWDRSGRPAGLAGRPVGQAQRRRSMKMGLV